jgi:uncharacterized protein (DUF849 family)
MEELQEEEGRKVWIEAAINGARGRRAQPNIPITVEEIIAEGIACVEAGAAIVHLHAYDEVTGVQRDDAELYAKIIHGIRSRVDAIVYPTVPFLHAGDGSAQLAPKERFAHLEALGQQQLLEWAAVDPGSCNITRWDQIQSDTPGFVYTNSEAHIRHALVLAERHQFHPSFAIYEPGFLRLGAALAWRESAPVPIYRFMFTSDYSFGFPPEDFAMTAYLHLIDRLAPGAPWMVAGLGVDILPLVPRAVMEGGHVRTGLEDVPLGSTAHNLDLVHAAVERVRNMGGEPATAADVRAALAAE